MALDFSYYVCDGCWNCALCCTINHYEWIDYYCASDGTEMPDYPPYSRDRPEEQHEKDWAMFNAWTRDREVGMNGICDKHKKGTPKEQ